MTKTIIAVFAVTSLYVGCSEEETDPPVRRADSGATSSGSDAGTTTQDSGTSTPTDAATGTDTGAGADTSTPSPCVAYCECMSATCAGKLSDCPTQCAAGTSWDVSCRTTHCNLAKTSDKTLHCGHAAGESTCQ